MNETRLGLNDDMMSAIVKLSDGSPGAFAVCTHIAARVESVDPDNTLGVYGPLFSFDTYNIYGPKIWVLYKEVCNENIVKTIACLRACQLGLMTIRTLKHAIANHGDGINCNQVLLDVQGRLPAFALGVEQ